MGNGNDEQRVLICEDERTTAFCIQKIIEEMGYKSDIAYTAKEAQNFLATKTYKFMTLDIILPDKSGLVLLEEIKNNEATKDLPIIILSATKPDFVNFDISKKIIYWIEKTFDLTNLEETANSIILDKPTDKVKILHVEDDEDLLTLISMTISDFAEITQINTLDKAAKAIQEKAYDIIIFDYMLSDGTCENIVNDIKNTPNKNAKLVLFSAYELSRELSSKFDKVLLKTTVSNDEFIKCIKNV